MRCRSALALATCLATAAATVSTQSTPDVKLPASPPGQAALQLGGTWEKTDGGQRYRDGKWIVVDYSRPLLRGRKAIDVIFIEALGFPALLAVLPGEGTGPCVGCRNEMDRPCRWAEIRAVGEGSGVG